VISVDIDEEHRIASVTVPERMLSLAIGREGQNARLAARLTGWRIDIRSDVSVAEARGGGERRHAGRRCHGSSGEAASESEAVAAPAKPKRVTKKAATGRRRPTSPAPPLPPRPRPMPKRPLRRWSSRGKTAAKPKARGERRDR
jgi:hypothetical protein